MKQKAFLNSVIVLSLLAPVVETPITALAENATIPWEQNQEQNQVTEINNSRIPLQSWWLVSNKKFLTVNLQQTKHAAAAHQAIQWWNKLAGKTLIKTTTAPNADLTIYDINNPTILAYAYTGSNHALILNTGLATKGHSNLPTVITHELGHALGLGHAADNSRQEVMSANLDQTTHPQPTADDKISLHFAQERFQTTPAATKNLSTSTPVPDPLQIQTFGISSSLTEGLNHVAANSDLARALTLPYQESLPTIKKFAHTYAQQISQQQTPSLAETIKAQIYLTILENQKNGVFNLHQATKLSTAEMEQALTQSYQTARFTANQAQQFAHFLVTVLQTGYNSQTQLPFDLFSVQFARATPNLKPLLNTTKTNTLPTDSLLRTTDPQAAVDEGNQVDTATDADTTTETDANETTDNSATANDSTPDTTTTNSNDSDLIDNTGTEDVADNEAPAGTYSPVTDTDNDNDTENTPTNPTTDDQNSESSDDSDSDTEQNNDDQSDTDDQNTTLPYDEKVGTAISNIMTLINTNKLNASNLRDPLAVILTSSAYKKSAPITDAIEQLRVDATNGDKNSFKTQLSGDDINNIRKDLKQLADQIYTATGRNPLEGLQADNNDVNGNYGFDTNDDTDPNHITLASNNAKPTTTTKPNLTQTGLQKYGWSTIIAGISLLAALWLAFSDKTKAWFKVKQRQQKSH